MSPDRQPRRGARALLCAAALAAALLPAARAMAHQAEPDIGEPPERPDARASWWGEAKVGLLIRWGLYAVPADATDLDGQRRDAEWYLANKQMQVADYEAFARQFDPAEFDADRWARSARDAGARYVVFTAKHHDGFCLFDSRLTDFDVVDATPFRRDPLKELAEACRRHGLRLGVYYSIMDWHHPDYLPRRPWEKQARPAAGADLDRYIEFMKGQLRELLTRYGPIAVLWFDGGWEHDAGQHHAREVVALARALQPGVLINNRINLPGDFDTPEQPPLAAPTGGRPWEACITLNDSRGYARDDHHWKGAVALIRTLCDVAGKGGNILLDVGPDERGAFPAEAIDRLEAIGRWMRINGRGIYGTTKGPYPRPPFDGRITAKGATLYLLVFRWPESGLALPGLKTAVRSARALDGGERLPVSVEESGRVRIGRPGRLDPAATVVELALAGPPEVEGVAFVGRAGPDGRLELAAADAQIEGQTARLESKGDDAPSIAFWTDPRDRVAWGLDVPEPRAYRVEVEYACPDDAAGSTFAVTTGEAKAGVEGRVAATGGWDRFRAATLPGTIRLDAGRHTLRVIPRSVPHGAVMGLRRVTLTPVPDPERPAR
jgi:alpha-L-fucosidase